MERKFRKASLVCAICALAFVVLATEPLRASFRQTWSAIAATCVVDDGSAGLLSFSDTGSVFFRSGVTSATAQLRCPVYPIGDMLQTADEVGGAWALKVVMRDTDGAGSTSRVIVSLKSVNLSRGTVTTYVTIDSNQSPDGGDQYFSEVRDLMNPDGSAVVSFFTYGEAYYVDIRLTKTTSTANPGVKAVQVFNQNS